MGRKQLCERFKGLISNISHEKNWKWLRKRIIDRNRISPIKGRIDKTQQNSKNILYGERDETINYIINKRCKLAQKEYTSRYDWVGMVIH